MAGPHPECSSKRFRMQLWSRPVRWFSALALVVALQGVGLTETQASVAPVAVSAADGSQATYAGPLSRPDVLHDDMGNDEEEEEAEEYEEDGLLPTGQAEQRAQGLGDKAEAHDEDHDN